MGIWKAMIIRMNKQSNYQWKAGGQDGECCVEERSTQKRMKVYTIKESAKSRLRSTDGDWGVPNLGYRAQMGIEEYRY